MEIKYLPENTNPQSSDWLLSENDTAAQKLSVRNLLALAATPRDLGISDINGLQPALDSKADIAALSAAVNAKANQSVVDNLATVVNTKINKSLVERNISVNDFLIIESAATGDNQKTKISNLPTTVITSNTEPSNKYQGLQWNEIDSFNYLIEQWIFINNQWVSFNKSYNTFTTAVTINSIISFFPINPAYNYLINKQRLVFFPNGSFTSTNYWNFKLDHIRQNGSLIKTFLNLNLEPYSSTISYSIERGIQQQLTPLTDGQPQALKLTGLKAGTGNQSVGIIFSSYIDYQLIRK